jgi:hypothetical protein
MNLQEYAKENNISDENLAKMISSGVAMMEHVTTPEYFKVAFMRLKDSSSLTLIIFKHVVETNYPQYKELLSKLLLFS